MQMVIMVSIEIWIYAIEATIFTNIRLFLAYMISLVFSLTVGIAAALNERLGKIIIPILDILQSVPILGFFPVAIYLLVAVFPDRIGVELASIFLIFTSQAWNITFGVYQSALTIPSEFKDLAKAYGIKGLKYVTRIVIPSTFHSLIYNSMMAWAGGWFFVTACEMISMGEFNIVLPGLGSFILMSAYKGDFYKLAIGLVMMLTSIILVNLLIWNPLLEKAEEYREVARSITSPTITVVSTSFLIDFLSAIYSKIDDRLHQLISKIPRETWNRILSKAMLILKMIMVGVIIAVVFLGVFCISKAFPTIIEFFFSMNFTLYLYNALTGTALTLFRIIVAYIISVGWILAVCILVENRSKLFAYSIIIGEVLASIPATIWYPAFIILIEKYGVDPNIASILIILTGMQWYIFFNVMGGVKGIPLHFRQVARLYNIRGRLYVSKIILPGILPFLVTGSISGWGGAWNTTILAEYITTGKDVIYIHGIGGLISRAANLGDVGGLFFYIMWMSIFIVLFNKLIWSRLYKVISEKYLAEL